MSKGHIRFHSIESLVLQCVGFQLLYQPDAATFLPLIDQHATFRSEGFERRMELRTAVASD